MSKQLQLLLLGFCLSGLAVAEPHDPTMPGNLPQTEFATLPSGETDLHLNSIWIAGKIKRATINGVRVRPGQTLADGSQVLNILPRYVLVRQNGSNKKLFLVPSVKNPVK